MNFVPVLLFSNDIYPVHCCFNQILTVAKVLYYLELIKLQPEHKVLYQLVQILSPQLQKK